MKKITTQQHLALDFIIIFRVENGFSPTIREIADGTGTLEKAALDKVTALEKKGYIETQPYRPRSIKILKAISIFHGTVGELFMQVAPKGTAKLFKEERKRG